MASDNATSAASYEHGSAEQRNVGMKLINKLTMEKGMIVLDLGCGTGYLTKVLSERVGSEGKVVAVDPDKDRLSIAKNLYSASNIEYIQADDQNFPSSKYDIIFCNVVVHWIHDKEALIKRVFENLQPGGCFAFTTYDVPIFPPVIYKLFALIGPDFLHKMLHDNQRYLPASDYQALASSVGFSNVLIETESVVTEWKNIDDFIITAHGVLQGEFEPKKIDSNQLIQLKQEYGGNTAIKRQFELIKAIATK
jgi:ubiquinone/menaquinone biosynthesis C-methylase UbiE